LQSAVMNRIFLLAIVNVSAFAIGGCTVVDQHAATPERLASHEQGIATSATECLEHLGNSTDQAAPELESTGIRLLSWNVKKGGQERWFEDFYELAAGRDLVLFQEAALQPEAGAGPESAGHWSFAPGYRTTASLTGVMTYSGTAPLAQCNLTSWEPWLNTPKATGVTEYGLTDTEATLIVINIHAINFALGVKDFRAQLEQIRPVLAQHDGPVILSGDFNTWRQKRLNILDAFVDEFALSAVEFDEDHRTEYFGKTVDHIYIRGLKVKSAGTRKVDSSDHNPLLVEFSL
jgi:endonuclease/exonuclease/phosphatase (EEP) superfamily protein YafD